MKNFIKKNQAIFIATIIAIFLPFVIYFIERKTGVLQNSDQYWATSGGNHGPWRNSIEGFFIVYSLPILIFITAARAAKSLYSKNKEEWHKLGSGILLILMQAAGIVLHFYFFFWTID